MGQLLKVVARTRMASTAAARWRARFNHLEGWSPGKQEVYERLVALGPLPEPDEVDKVAGMNWTRVLCENCGNVCDFAIELHFSSEAFFLCKNCLENCVEGLQIVEGHANVSKENDR